MKHSNQFKINQHAHPIAMLDKNRMLTQKRKSVRSAAFTLIEVMVVVVIMAILAAIIVPQILSRPDQARIVAAHQDILSIENAMELYKLDNGVYPSTDQGIQALVVKPSTDPIPQNWNGPYIKGTLPKDPWGNAYHYQNPGQHGDIDIFSYGPKNQPDGTGKDATIGNWQK